jgi:hypothetical protein
MDRPNLPSVVRDAGTWAMGRPEPPDSASATFDAMRRSDSALVRSKLRESRRSIVNLH